MLILFVLKVAILGSMCFFVFFITLSFRNEALKYLWTSIPNITIYNDRKLSDMSLSLVKLNTNPVNYTLWWFVCDLNTVEFFFRPVMTKRWRYIVVCILYYSQQANTILTYIFFRRGILYVCLYISI